MVTFASTVLALLLRLHLPASLPAVDVVFIGASMPPRVEASAMREVTSIWSRYGVDIQRIGAHDAGRCDAIRLFVRVAGTRQKGLIYMLGSIAFEGDRPTPAITMYPDAIATLVSDAALFESLGVNASPARRDVVLGRVFGRALAHEIGHYLLRSRGHSAAGLMRAQPPAAALAASEPRGFGLSGGELARLAAMQGALRR